MLFITLYMSIVPNIGRFHIQKLKFSKVELLRKKKIFFHAQNLHFVVQKVSLWSVVFSSVSCWVHMYKERFFCVDNLPLFWYFVDFLSQKMESGNKTKMIAGNTF